MTVRPPESLVVVSQMFTDSPAALAGAAPAVTNAAIMRRRTDMRETGRAGLMVVVMTETRRYAA